MKIYLFTHQLTDKAEFELKKVLSGSYNKHSRVRNAKTSVIFFISVL